MYIENQIVTHKSSIITKRFFLAFATVALSGSAVAQNTVTVPEPEFVNSYVYLTSDSTFSKLPKETAEFKKHESGMSKFAKIAGGVADVAGSVGFGVAMAGGSVGAVMGGIQTMSTAAGVSNIAYSVDNLAGFNGMDIVFDGKESAYTIPQGNDVRIIYRAENNNTDPMDFLRVVQFKKGKKDRKVQWKVFSSSLLGTEKERKNGYLPFDATKYGESSYLITIPASALKEGEYGIISPSMVEATIIPIATFGISK